MRKTHFALLLTAAFLTASTSLAFAQEVQITGPLAGQPAVRHMRVYRASRINIVPSIGYTLTDEFSRGVMFGGQLNYHFVDWLGVGLWGGAMPLNVDTDLTSQVSQQGQTNARNVVSLPSRDGFSSQVGRMRGALGLQLLFAPLRGKLSLFQSIFLDTDLYIIAGASLFWLEERASWTNPGGVCSGAAVTPDACTQALVQNQRQRATRIAVTPMFGVGLSMYINSLIGIAFEWRAFPFSWNPSGTDESGLDARGNSGAGYPNGIVDGNDSRTTFNHMMTVGLIINLPPDQQQTD